MAPERIATLDWPTLKAEYPSVLVDALHSTLESAHSSVLDPTLLGPPFEADLATTVRLLKEVARLGVLTIEEVRLCGNCDALASVEDQAAGTCARCGSRYDELDTPFKTKQVFRLPAGRESRDVSWVVTAHGMNTDGPWQQEFSWLIANKLKYSVPVLILKYPVFRVMVLFERTQRRLVTDLGAQLKAAVAHARLRGDELKEAPDIVLHSYATLLFARLLLENQFSDLKFGRVIFGGSIVAPDYDWAPHVKLGRVEQVINHCGDQDWIVEIAQFVIPGSGPSGRNGFVDRTARNVRAKGFGHGTFFELEPMKANLLTGGAWDRFLTYPARTLAAEDEINGPSNWQPNPSAAITRHLAKALSPVLGPITWFVMQAIAAISAVIRGR